MTNREDNVKQEGTSSEVLTEAQVEFAKLLGRLLSRRWQEEHKPKAPEKPDGRNTGGPKS